MSQPVWILERQESLAHVAFCPTRNKWVLASGTTIKDSPDGFVFTAVTYPFTDSIQGLAGTDTGSNRGNIVVITSSNSRIYELDDAGNWSNVTPGLSGTFSQILYQPGIGFIVLGVRLGNPVTWVSTDGVTWVGPSPRNFANTVGYLGTPGIIASINGGTAVDFSPDGSSWTTEITGLSPKLVCQFAYVPSLASWIGYAVDVGQTNTWIVKCDADATNFTVVHTFGSFITPQNLIFEPRSGYVVLICQQDTLISTDGVSWTSIGMIDPDGFASNSSGIAGIAGRIVVLGLSGGTWSPNDNIMAVLIDDDLNPFVTWPVNSGNNPVGGLSVSGSNPYNITFTANNNKPPIHNYTVQSSNVGGGNTKIVASPINPGGSNSFSITDNITTGPGKKVFTVFGIDSENAEITPVVTFETGADIDVTMDGGVSVGGAANMVFIADPSGIYTLVKGKTHDTLYERLSGTTTQDVKIPDPFFITPPIGVE